jgi:hypothetical protein
MTIDYLAQHDRAFELTEAANKAYQASAKAASDALATAKLVADKLANATYDTTRNALAQARQIRPRTPALEAKIAGLEASLRDTPLPAPDYSAALAVYHAEIAEADKALRDTLADIRSKRDRGEL